MCVPMTIGSGTQQKTHFHSLQIWIFAVCRFVSVSVCVCCACVNCLSITIIYCVGAVDALFVLNTFPMDFLFQAFSCCDQTCVRVCVNVGLLERVCVCVGAYVNIYWSLIYKKKTLKWAITIYEPIMSARESFFFVVFNACICCVAGQPTDSFNTIAEMIATMMMKNEELIFFFFSFHLFDVYRITTLTHTTDSGSRTPVRPDQNGPAPISIPFHWWKTESKIRRQFHHHLLLLCRRLRLRFRVSSWSRWVRAQCLVNWCACCVCLCLKCIFSRRTHTHIDCDDDQ